MVLLDDPFAAIDAKVGDSLFADCITGLLEGTTRILCTHQAKYAAGSARVLLLGRDGTSTIVNTSEHELPVFDDDEHEAAADGKLKALSRSKPHAGHGFEGNGAGALTPGSDSRAAAESRAYGSLSKSVLLRYVPDCVLPSV